MSGIGRRAVLGAGVGAVAAGAVTVAGASRAIGEPAQAGGRVTPGADRLAAAGWAPLQGRRLGVITNPTGVLQSNLGSIVDAMVATKKIEIGGVFGPEHGFRGTAQAGESEATYVDPRTGVTVYDAYGASADKFASLFAQAEVQTVVFDIQDVGARFYTYIWTLYEAMVAAARSGLDFVILDRPNPVGGQARGPLLRKGYTSGVGEDRIVQQHGMTVGELARFFDGEFLPGVAGRRITNLSVVQVTGWHGSQLFADTELTWVMPSPNVPTPDTALVYPGLCLFEATNLSEGRGTTRPFELIGAPYVDYHWAAKLNEIAAGAPMAGVRFRETYFTPTFSKNENKVCGGVQVEITDPHRFDAIAVVTYMFTTLRDLYPGQVDWRDGDGPGNYWIDLLTGSDRYRLQLAAGASPERIIAAWKDELAGFERERRPYLLYPRGTTR